AVVLLFEPEQKRGPEFRAQNSGYDWWHRHQLIPFRRVLLVARLGHCLLLLRIRKSGNERSARSPQPTVTRSTHAVQRAETAKCARIAHRKYSLALARPRRQLRASKIPDKRFNRWVKR